MNIKGLGDSMIGELVRSGKVASPSDLYRLSVSDISGLERSGDKKAFNVVEAINESKTRSLDKVIPALGISNIGRSAGRDVASEFRNMNEFMNASDEMIERVFGNKVNGNTVKEWIRNPSNRMFIQELASLGLSMESDSSALKSSREQYQNNKNGKFAGKSCVVTGTWKFGSREQVEKFIIQEGGTIASSVSAKTNITAYGENAGSKLAKSKQLNESGKANIEILSEAEFFERYGTKDQTKSEEPVQEENQLEFPFSL